MGDLIPFNKMVEDFSQKVDFLTVYIREIHGTDGWVFGNYRYQLELDKCLEDRLKGAKMLNEETIHRTTIVVDPMNNETCSAYGGWPQRFVVILDGKVEYISGKGPFEINTEEVENILKKLCDRKLN